MTRQTLLILSLSGLICIPPVARAQGGSPLSPTPPPAMLNAHASWIPDNVVRIYIEPLQGADGNVIAGLATQYVFQAQGLVITENEANAELILQGAVEREAAASGLDPRLPVSGAKGRAATTGGPTRSGSPPVAAPCPAVADVPRANAVGYGPPVAPNDALAALATLNATDAAVNLSDYKYRLELQLVTPAGDLVWLSGRGKQALGFEQADVAVAKTLKPMIDVVTGRAHTNTGTNDQP